MTIAMNTSFNPSYLATSSASARVTTETITRRVRSARTPTTRYRNFDILARNRVTAQRLRMASPRGGTDAGRGEHARGNAPYHLACGVPGERRANHERTFHHTAADGAQTSRRRSGDRAAG